MPMYELEDVHETVCEFNGCDYEDAGGGLSICVNCGDEEWSDILDFDPSGRCDVYGSLDDGVD